MGMLRIYGRTDREQLGLAKKYLTELALDQLSEKKINEYL